MITAFKVSLIAGRERRSRCRRRPPGAWRRSGRGEGAVPGAGQGPSAPSCIRCAEDVRGRLPSKGSIRASTRPGSAERGRRSLNRAARPVLRCRSGWRASDTSARDAASRADARGGRGARRFRPRRIRCRRSPCQASRQRDGQIISLWTLTAERSLQAAESAFTIDGNGVHRADERRVSRREPRLACPGALRRSTRHRSVRHTPEGPTAGRPHTCL